ncbi:MAG TPA: response regulator transcription factor [Actinomycetota bacterium]|nr:response regulator transcription factor [Actinomycetota bacterium]
MTDPIRVLIIDDHRMFADALQLLLGGEDDIDMAAAASTAEEALEVAGTVLPDVVLMDIDLPGIDGIEATRILRQRQPQARVVIITAFQQPDVIASAIDAGASGYVPKTHAADELVGVIRRAAAGEMVLPSKDIGAILGRLQKVREIRTDEGQLVARLTPRELEVLQLLADGKSTAEIAQSLFISPRTVRSHVKSVLAKLGAHSKLEAVTMALRYGVIRVGRLT